MSRQTNQKGLGCPPTVLSCCSNGQTTGSVVVAASPEAGTQGSVPAGATPHQAQNLQECLWLGTIKAGMELGLPGQRSKDKEKHR